jgi:hypothetical protein
LLYDRANYRAGSALEEFSTGLKVDAVRAASVCCARVDECFPVYEALF